MDCSALNDKLIDYEAGVLPADEGYELEQHLLACAPCMRERAAQSQTWQMLDAWAEVEPSHEFDGRLRQRLDAAAICLPFVDRLPSYDEKTLPAALQEEVDRHLNTCQECRHELESLRETWSLLGAWTEIEVSPQFTQRVLQAARGSAVVTLQPRQSAPKLSWWRSAVMPRVAAAVVALCLGIGFLFGYVPAGTPSIPGTPLQIQPQYSAENEEDLLPAYHLHDLQQDASTEEIVQELLSDPQNKDS